MPLLHYFAPAHALTFSRGFRPGFSFSLTISGMMRFYSRRRSFIELLRDQLVTWTCTINKCEHMIVCVALAYCLDTPFVL